MVVYPAEAVKIIHDHFTGRKKVGENLPKFESDEEEPTGEGTRIGVPPKRQPRT